MKNLRYLSFLLAGLLLVCPGCSKSPASAIEAVLNKCAKLTEQINQSNLTGAEAANALAAKMQDIDVRDCPQDFRVAFQEHINAWRDAVPALANNNGLTAFFEGVATGLSGDISHLGQASTAAQVAAQRINSTYSDLVRIAAYYGARVPQSSLNQ